MREAALQADIGRECRKEPLRFFSSLKRRKIPRQAEKARDGTTHVENPAYASPWEMSAAQGHRGTFKVLKEFSEIHYAFQLNKFILPPPPCSDPH